ncbi:hypothetical protein B0T22DRAFT_246269 [Podospora appendiculata]|uniref:Uncharacterized protein n=1 Tax=Podospora appendiculata TaxID=314037 RepID=A0AAE0X1Z8_9PEZI|nr:hypothetical protein B0T22DRAFT_246269 [Podospora appendiculata]
MNQTDEELDRDWKPNGRRPQSTIARSFSQELGDIFRIENSIADLDEKVNKRKQQITTQTSELEALEARIREMEARLKGQLPNSAESSSNSNLLRPSGSSPQRTRPAVGNAFATPTGPPPPPPAKNQSRAEAQQQQHKYGGSSRPGTARQSQQAVPGALPPTPVGSEGECEPTAHQHHQLPPPPVPLHPRPSSNTTEDDSKSINSMASGTTFADYVIVPRLDGDEREQDI